VQRTTEAKVEFTKLKSRLDAINAIAAVHRDEVDPTLQARLAAIVEYVIENILAIGVLMWFLERFEACGRQSSRSSSGASSTVRDRP